MSPAVSTVPTETKREIVCGERRGEGEGEALIWRETKWEEGWFYAETIFLTN